MEKEVEEKIRSIGKNHDHSFHKRSENKIELVRMMGDQIDSRITIQFDETDGLLAEYRFWLEGEGNVESDDICDKWDDCKDFYKELEELVKRGNKRFKIECIKRDENPEEW
jgi:hypothetical protein